MGVSEQKAICMSIASAEPNTESTQKMEPGVESPRSRSRSRSPVEDEDSLRRRSPEPRTASVVDEREDVRMDGGERQGMTNIKPSNVLGVFGLHFETREPDLERVFGAYGKITNCSIIFDHHTRSSRGFGFITFETVEEATKALESTAGLELNGRSIRVDYSKTEGAHAPTPGKYMGERRGRGNYQRSYYDRAPGRRYEDRGRDYDRGRDRGYDRYDDRRGYDRGASSRYEEPFRRPADDYYRSGPPQHEYDRYAPRYDDYRARSPPRHYR